MVTQRREWVLLSYRIPREPSTPRIAVWRRLRQLGAVQIVDGLVALPADPRTIEHLDWVAEQVLEAQGSAIVWTAKPANRSDDDQLVAQINAARDDEYGALTAEIEATEPPAPSRTIARWRRQYRQIERRDFFSADSADTARLALEAIAGHSAPKARL
jgi:hypothetical protein